MENLKQIILVRKDIKIPVAKLGVQIAHASVESVLKSKKTIVEKWRNEGMKKVVLRVEDKNELLIYKRKAEEIGLITSLIVDAGKTVFPKPTITCLSIGPDMESKIDLITKNLKLF